MKGGEAKNSAEKAKKHAGKDAAKGANKRKRHSEKSEKTQRSDDPQKNGHEKENAEEPQKLNAFQFMMNSRQKSIGRNSPGRESVPDDAKEDPAKRELKARKSRFQSWAEQKGAAKRKREYEEIGNCIDHKLEKRSQKLRKLLNIDCQSDDEVIRKRKKKCAVIESDGESAEKGSLGEGGEKKRKKRMALNPGCALIKSDGESAEKGSLGESGEKKDKNRKKRTSLNPGCVVIESDGESAEKGSLGESGEKKVKKRKKRMSLNPGPQLTPKSVKAWQFKIKLCMNENAENNCDPEMTDQNEKVSETLDLESVEKSTKDENAELDPEMTDGSSQNEQESKIDLESVDSDHSENLVQNGIAHVQSGSLRENTAQNETAHAQRESQTENTAQSETAHAQSESQVEDAAQNEIEHAQSELQTQDETAHAQSENGDIVAQDSQTESTTENESTDQVAETGSKTVDDPTLDDAVPVVDDESDNVATRVLRTRRCKPKIDDDFLSDPDDEDWSMSRQKTKKTIKMAPVFLKAMPKPKLDPKLVEARRQFLMSGVPSSLKKEMEKQQCLEDIEFDVFPTVSHVQQRSPENQFWDLPKTELKLLEPESGELEIEAFSGELLSLENAACVNTENRILPNKIKNCKRIIREIKSRNPNYPVYRIYNSIYDQSGYRTEKYVEMVETKIETVAPRKRGRPKKIPDKKPEPKMVKIDIKPDETVHSLWTEKYKPKSSSDIIGNHGSVVVLKDWLTYWLSSAKKFKNKKKNSDSESEFVVTDSDSRDSTRLNGNTVILKGPGGSGKTAAVYAICNELGFDVLEVNASSKRTGKRLLQELQEATQSHQVCKKENLFSSFIKEKKEKPTEKASTKMCVLFIEDVDLVFDQDEGFSAALSQIIATSKRPIILTTTEEPSCNIQKVLYNYQTIHFRPLTSILTTWLQIVCLVEGLHVHAKALDELLNYNRGDIRRTLLQLQLYVNSGGQLYKSDDQIGTETEVILENGIKIDDDNSNLSDLRLDESSDNHEKAQIHHDCLIGNSKTSRWPPCNNLGVIWWNFPGILNTPNLTEVRLERSRSDVAERKHEIDKQKLRLISDCYESLAYADVVCGKSQPCDSLKRRWRTTPKDGLGLEENMAGYRDCEFGEELAMTLLNGRMKAYGAKYDEALSSFKMAVPEPTERRWRSKNLSCEEKLQQALQLSDSLARKSLALDYVPYLRTIAKFDFEQSSSNTKRGNRFYSYLKTLGVRCGEATYQLASGVFQVWD